LKLDIASSSPTKQTAMESKIQKSTQSNRKGEVAEGLPGSLKSVACEEKHQSTWETQLVPRNCEVSVTDVNIGDLMTSWESDQLVLRERESRSQGEGADVIRSQQSTH